MPLAGGALAVDDRLIEPPDLKGQQGCFEKIESVPISPKPVPKRLKRKRFRCQASVMSPFGSGFSRALSRARRALEDVGYSRRSR